ncbi:hypothetical protein SAMN02745132_03120 [Enterovibrio nigricans DSM 22720]|uniref:Uncharacterized protein n=1 Tax=Enterovibrio nigricans DSM 22720 TaxID=1121868 RepID=A0A1T4V326_9GAMM|nr:hypothetical protein SAMN02745132_03120 [Enterovibrio nigricans DSM 22720]
MTTLMFSDDYHALSKIIDHLGVSTENRPSSSGYCWRVLALSGVAWSFLGFSQIRPTIEHRVDVMRSIGTS